MNQEYFGFKELFDVQLKASQNVTIGDKTIEEGEPIAVFKSIQYGNIEEVRDYMAAKGGFGNTPRVTWETTREVHMNFTQGVFSKIHLALLGNSFIASPDKIEVPMMEQHDADEYGIISLKHTPSTMFIYDSEGNRLSGYVVNGKNINIGKPFEKNVQIVYDFLYDNDITVLEIGRHWLDGFMELRGKTRLKDDKKGHTITGIISVPKIKLMSDLSIRLGNNVSPVVGNFNLVAFPVGPRGSQKVMDFILLNDDIDSDL